MPIINDQVHISNAIVLPIAKLCSSLGIENDLLKTQLEKINLSDIGATIPAEEAVSLIEMLHSETHEKKDLGFLLGEMFDFEYTPEFTTYIQSLASIRDFLKSAGWLGQFFSSDLNLQYEETEKEVSLYLPSVDIIPLETSPLVRRTLIEGVFTYILKVVRGVIGPEPDTFVIRVTYPDPGIPEIYQQFFSAPVEYNAVRNEIAGATDDLDKPLQGTIPALNEKARDSLEKKLVKIKSSQTASNLILNILRTDPAMLGSTIAILAEKIHIGERTLQRRLQKEGTNFFNLQDQAKHHLAVEMLRNKKHSIEQISDQLGFSDRRSFSRAFQRWQSCSPSQYRSDQIK